jgi:hypothetical protein
MKTIYGLIVLLVFIAGVSISGQPGAGWWQFCSGFAICAASIFVGIVLINTFMQNH